MKASPLPTTAQSGAQGHSNWPSSQPIVVGRPIDDFEPGRVDGNKHRVTPYRVDTALDGWSTEQFSVRGASVRGYAHRADGSPRQDDFALYFKPEEGRLIVEPSLRDALGTVGYPHAVLDFEAVTLVPQRAHAR